MAVSVMQVARTLGRLSGWSLSNLELQKMAYIADMLHLGRHDAPLVQENWQAWDYGPVQPDLYHKAKVYGSSGVRDIFHLPEVPEGNENYRSIVDSYKLMSNLSAGQMVNVTHKHGGAWARNYRSGARGRTIPKSDIREEYGTLINDRD